MLRMRQMLQMAVRHASDASRPRSPINVFTRPRPDAASRLIVRALVPQLLIGARGSELLLWLFCCRGDPVATRQNQ